MKFINTDGMAFIGPGSEWFWTALSGIIMAITFIAIWRQLSLQRSQNARAEIDDLSREWESERMLRHGLEILVALRNGADRAHVPDGSASVIANFWDKTGGMVRRGYLDRSSLHHTYGTGWQWWWATLAPMVRRWRTEQGDADLLSDFEWAAGFMDEMDRRRRRATPTFDEAWLISALADRIAYCEGAIRVEQSLRTVIVASPDTLTVGQPATTTPAATQG